MSLFLADIGKKCYIFFALINKLADNERRFVAAHKGFDTYDNNRLWKRRGYLTPNEKINLILTN